ncbi:MAG: hypothetical protein ABW133_13990 [Polyangiaceae bacterium]
MSHDLLGQPPASAPTLRTKLSAVEGLYAAGHRLLQASRPADAARIFRAMLACAPNDERGWLALGACHEGLSQNDIALELYGAGSALVPKSVECDLARARLLQLLGDDARAEQARERARTRAEALDNPELLQRVCRQLRCS